MPTVFDVVYLSDDNMCLVYPNSGKYNEYVGGNATVWNFKSAGETDPDIINDIATMENTRGKVYYDLQGRPVKKPKNGVYILGNRKVFVNSK